MRTNVDVDYSNENVADLRQDLADYDSCNPQKIEQSERNELLKDDLPAIFGCVAGIYFFLSIAHFLFILPPFGLPLSSITFGATVFIAGLFVISRKKLISPRASHPVLFMAGCLVLAVSTHHFYLLEQTFQATNFALILMGWGLMVLSVRWFVVYYCLIGVTWMTVVQLHPHDPALVAHYSFMLISSAGVGTTAFLIRYRSYNKAIIHTRESAAARESLQRALDLALQADHAERRTEAKSTFLAQFSHELRTPLNAVVGFSEMIRLQTMGPIGNEKYEEYVGDIHDAGLHLTSMLEDLHDLALIEKGELTVKFATCHVDQILEQATTLITPRATSKNIQVTCECDPNLRYITTDEKRLRQILTNLLTNGIKYTPENGKVSLTGKLETDGRILFEISDTGIGMSKAELENATSPFWRAAQSSSLPQNEGSGLGLAITQKLVSLLGATFELSSTENEGSCARVWLPHSCLAMDRPSNNPFEAVHFSR